ncbi:MAG: YbaK/EbsC family protein [Chloroflexi bacterium]|jgi:prolyl-tRNA editing enzyme YbaK/EbsC (Cys-tRNA(Pro) deacylase)|nr:YbaK/EbsC family protein [Chloroflexota bacterium]
MMILNRAALSRFILEQGIQAEILPLAAETPTVAAAAAVMGVSPDQIIKSVLFLADGAPVLVVTNGLARIAWKRLADYLGVPRRRLKTAVADQVLALTGYPVGAVPPFGHLTSWRTVVDTAVYDQSIVYGGGGETHALMRLTTAELRRVVGHEAADLSE